MPHLTIITTFRGIYIIYILKMRLREMYTSSIFFFSEALNNLDLAETKIPN